MSIKLRELIRMVRACKTAAEERAVIAKESALIRTSFRDTGLCTCLDVSVFAIEFVFSLFNSALHSTPGLDPRCLVARGH